MTVEQLIRSIDSASSPAELIGATRSLAAAREVAAIPTLIRVLGYNNPGAAVAAVDGLVQLGDAAVPTLIAQLDGYDYGARAWAVRALSQIGNPQALGILVDAACNDFALSVRRAAAKGLGSMRWTAATAAGRSRAFAALERAAGDPEWVVRYAAIVGLQGLASDPAWTDAVRDRLQQTACDLDAAVAARARHALAALPR